MTTSEEKLKRLKVDCIYGKKKHFNAADRKENYHYWIGIPLTVITILTTTILFYVLTDGATNWVKYVPLVLAFAASFLSGFQTYFNFNKQVEGHRRVANKYFRLVRSPLSTSPKRNAAAVSSTCCQRIARCSLIVATYAPIEIVPKIRLVWHTLISQLAKENRKFMYGQIKKGARAKDFETAINWLSDAGMVLKVSLVEKPTIPLNAYADMDVFKLFLLDIGLLNALARIDPKILLEKNNILTEFKGTLTEQFVAQQLKINHELYY